MRDTPSAFVNVYGACGCGTYAVYIFTVIMSVFSFGVYLEWYLRGFILMYMALVEAVHMWYIRIYGYYVVFKSYI